MSLVSCRAKEPLPAGPSLRVLPGLFSLFLSYTFINMFCFVFISVFIVIMEVMPVWFAYLLLLFVFPVSCLNKFVVLIFFFFCIVIELIHMRFSY